MNEEVKRFLELINNTDNEIETIFGDIFIEFIVKINKVDLSKETIKDLNKTFEKDMKRFFYKCFEMQNKKQLYGYWKECEKNE